MRLGSKTSSVSGSISSKAAGDFFSGLLHLQTISIAPPYGKVVVLSLRERGFGADLGHPSTV
jgi:hypothetical protein